MLTNTDKLLRLQAGVYYLRDCYRQKLAETNARTEPLSESGREQRQGEAMGIASCCDLLATIMREQHLDAP